MLDSPSPQSSLKPSMRSAIRAFEVMEAFREAAALEDAGRDIVHLSLGQPGRKPPQPVLDHVMTALQASSLGYTDACGLPALRTRISQYYQERYALDVPASRIFITIGSSAAYFLSMIAAFDAGARVGIALPCYPAYPNIMEALGIVPVFLNTQEANGFQPTIADIEKAGALDGLIIASPSNPAGSVLKAADLQALCDYCAAQHIRIISDEIYHHITYDNAAYDTVARFNDDAIIVNSFSKYFLLPGWRLGWAVMPQSLTRAYESLLQSFFVSPSAIAQQAGLTVFEHQDALQEVVADYAFNRDTLKETLQTLGFTGLDHAQGAFYLYANITAFNTDSRKFCHDMLHEAGVCAVPGYDFDPVKGADYVRFSFCGEHHRIVEACSRLRSWRAS